METEGYQWVVGGGGCRNIARPMAEQGQLERSFVQIPLIVPKKIRQSLWVRGQFVCRLCWEVRVAGSLEILRIGSHQGDAGIWNENNGLSRTSK